MRRREVVAGLFASSLPMPLAAQGRTGRIGYLALLQNERLFNALVRGLEDHGHVLNTNIVIEARSAEGDPARLEEAAAALVAQKPDLIVAVGNAATRAARRAAGAIPIVFAPSGLQGQLSGGRRVRGAGPLGVAHADGRHPNRVEV